MKISILCTNKNHPIFPQLESWQHHNASEHEVELVDSRKLLSGGDLLILISCSEIIGQDIRDRYQKTLVIHASDLPKGRGWSPHIWQVIEGKKEIMVSLLEAENAVDSGAIWSKKSFSLEGHELWDEINEKLFAVEVELMNFAVENFDIVNPKSQKDIEPSYYPKRNPDNSKIDPRKSIDEQFDLLRVCDPERYPAYFELRGYRYKVILEKIGKEA